MTRMNSFTIVAGLLCATSAWFTVSRANDESAATTQTDQVALLVARVEKLEKRIATLEGKEHATRQVNAVANPWTPQTLPSEPPQTIESSRPKARVFLLRHTQSVKE